MSSIATATIILAVFTFVGSLIIALVTGYSIKKNNDQAWRTRKQIIRNRNMDFLKMRIELISDYWNNINDNFQHWNTSDKLYKYFKTYHSYLIDKDRKLITTLQNDFIGNEFAKFNGTKLKETIENILKFELNIYYDSMNKITSHTDDSCFPDFIIKTNNNITREIVIEFNKLNNKILYRGTM